MKFITNFCKVEEWSISPTQHTVSCVKALKQPKHGDLLIAIGPFLKHIFLSKKPQLCIRWPDYLCVTDGHVMVIKKIQK